MRERYRGQRRPRRDLPADGLPRDRAAAASACRTTTPRCSWALKQLDDLCIEEDDTLRLQPCLSPVWDTALSLIGARGRGRTGAIRTKCERGRARGCSTRKCGSAGDWAKTVRGVEPGGWFFEYRNAFYPDTDDTAMVLIALARTGHATRTRAARPFTARSNWLLAMQNRDGGWAAFDRDIDKRGSDEGAVRRPQRDARPELPGHHRPRARSARPLRLPRRPAAGRSRGARSSSRGRRTNGSWFGRWGVNYIYGTWQVLVGLAAVGFDMTQPVVRRAVRWLKDVQNADGGWGESCRSYDDPSHGRRRAHRPRRRPRGRCSACSPPAKATRAEVRAGIEYLLGTQDARRHLDRGAVHRHRLPARLLPEVSPVPGLLPADGAGPLLGSCSSASEVRHGSDTDARHACG